jgi:hypothetical protein
MTSKWEAQIFTSVLHYLSTLTSACIHLAGSLLDNKGHKEAIIYVPLPKPIASACIGASRPALEW